MKDLYGREIVKDVLIRDEFLEPPFSILDTRSGSWQKRKRQWNKLGIKSEIGRDSPVLHIGIPTKADAGKIPNANYTSIFDPALTELMYHWFCPKEGKILDPFAGGSVRGIVANYLGYKYTGIDIREEQVLSNQEQASTIIPDRQPMWLIGDSNKVLDDPALGKFDMIFSCPPYADLEVYSKLEGDISNMPYNKFKEAYGSIIKKSCSKLKDGGYAVFVVGEVRDKNGNYIGFVPDTVNAFKDAGMHFYNEAILINSFGSAAIRARGNMKSGKLVKVHQNILVFRK